MAVWVKAILAAAVLALILVPGEVWSSPDSDFTQHGFDADLVYENVASRHIFNPFLVLENGTWQACPCTPGTELTISGQGLSDTTVASEGGDFELNGTRVLVNGEPAVLHLITQSQINFVLPAETAAPVATLAVETQGVVWARDSVGVRSEALGAGDSIDVEREEMRLEAAPGQEPSVHLLTTPLSFRASFEAVVERMSSGAAPLQVSFWNPRNFSSFEIVFLASREIEARFIESRGRAASVNHLGTYEPGASYDVRFEWRRDESASITLVGEGIERVVELPAEDAPALFDAYRPSLTATATGHDGGSSASLTHYRLDLLPERFTTVRIEDGRVPPIMVGVAAGAALLLALSLLLGPTAPIRRLRSMPGRVSSLASKLFRSLKWRSLLLMLMLATPYLALNFYLFTVGSQPFDMGSQARWAHIAVAYGPTEVYYASQTATLAGVWNGMPYHEAVFPYNAAMSYYFWVIGETHQLFFGHTSPDSQSMHVMIKSFNFAFMIADAIVVYAILRHMKPDARWLPWIGAGMLLLNPAFIFDTAVWGETEAVVLLPILASLLAALKDRPGMAWSLLAIAFLSKQTVLPAVLVIGVYYMVRFPLRRNVESFSGSMLVVLAVILPYTLSGYPPSIAIDPTLAALWVHGSTGAEDIFQVVSYDAFNMWTLVTHLADGAAATSRFQAPDQTTFAGLTYQRIGTLMLAAAIVLTMAFILLRRRRLGERPEALFLLIAVVFLAELFLPTRTLSRYFLFVAVFAGIGVSGRARWPALAATLGLTATTFVGEYGSMALVLEDFPTHAPNLAPQNNAASRLMADLFTSDLFITIAVLVNGVSLFTLAVAAWLSTGGEASVPQAEPERLALVTASLVRRGESRVIRRMGADL